MDLTLISMDDLIGEMFTRKEAAVVAYTEYLDGEEVVITRFKGKFISQAGLVTVLQHDIMNTPNKKD